MVLPAATLRRRHERRSSRLRRQTHASLRAAFHTCEGLQRHAVRRANAAIDGSRNGSAGFAIMAQLLAAANTVATNAAPDRFHVRMLHATICRRPALDPEVVSAPHAGLHQKTDGAAPVTPTRGHRTPVESSTSKLRLTHAYVPLPARFPGHNVGGWRSRRACIKAGVGRRRRPAGDPGRQAGAERARSAPGL